VDTVINVFAIGGGGWGGSFEKSSLEKRGSWEVANSLNEQWLSWGSNASVGMTAYGSPPANVVDVYTCICTYV